MATFRDLVKNNTFFIFLLVLVCATEAHVQSTEAHSAKATMSTPQKTISTTDNQFGLWPNAIVPYYMTTDFNSDQKHIIMTKIMTIAFKTCIKLVPLTERPGTETHAMIIENPNTIQECALIPAIRHNYNIIVTLGNDCLQTPNLNLIILQALGYSFETKKYIETILKEIDVAYKPLCMRRDQDMQEQTCEQKRFKRESHTKTQPKQTVEKSYVETNIPAKTYSTFDFDVLVKNSGLQNEVDEIYEKLHKIITRALNIAKVAYCKEPSRYALQRRSETDGIVNMVEGINFNIGNFFQKLIGSSGTSSNNVPDKNNKRGTTSTSAMPDTSSDEDDQNETPPDWRIEYIPANIGNFSKLADKAVVAGYDADGSPMWVMRATDTKGAGCLFVDKQRASLANRTVTDFQVLVAPPHAVRWVPTKMGDLVPRGAIETNRNKYYWYTARVPGSGKAKPEHRWIPGYVGANISHILLSLNFNYNGALLTYDDYEVLCRNIY